MRWLLILTLSACGTDYQNDYETTPAEEHYVEDYDVECGGHWIDGGKVRCKSDCVVKCYVLSTKTHAIRWNFQCVPHCVY